MDHSRKFRLQHARDVLMTEFTSVFDSWAAAYEAMIDWPKRLAYEAPFLQRQFEAVGARRVLDAACGSGRHAEMFFRWGLEVEGADLSPAMIAEAQRRCPESPRLRWRVRDLRQPAAVPGEFDAAVCLGNSLALLPDEQAVVESLRSLWDAIRPGGRLIVQAINVERLPDGPPQWQKCVRASLPQGERMLVKGVQRCGERAFVHLIAAALDPRLHWESTCSELLTLDARRWRDLISQLPGAICSLYGNYEGHPFQPETSPDVILAADKDIGG